MFSTFLPLGILTASSLLYSGCTTGPAYEYSKQQDSASVEGPAVPIQGPEDGDCTIIIVQMDGLTDNYTASHQGLNWPVFAAIRPLYVAPGKHSFVLDIAYVDEAVGEGANGFIGDVGEYAAGSKPTISVNLMANHVYRLAANLNGRVIDVTLWDETSGHATRSRAASWTCNSNGDYSAIATPK